MGTPSKKAPGPGHVTTPRSVPSPAATRKGESGKTPINHPTASSHGTKTLGGTPMVQSLSQTGMTVGSSSSPGGHMGSYGTPHGLGVDLGSGTPGQMNVPTPLLQSVAMGPSLSEIMQPPKRNEEEERRAKMRGVMGIIGRRKGRCSEESIARVARRVGLINDIDFAPGVQESAEEKRKRLDDEQRKAGNQTIFMSGPAEKFSIEVKLKEHVAQDVIVEFRKSETEMERSKPASKVLLDHLTAPNGVLLHTYLDNFAANLNALARMDKLSSAANGSINCFHAISGVHASLKKLYDLEKEAVKALKKYTGSNTEQRIAREVMCKRSGKPTIHENGRMGLSLHYWTSGSSHMKSKQDNSAMDVDGAACKQGSQRIGPQVWSLHIEAEKWPAGVYTSLRVSDAWLPETFELPSAGSGDGIPWQEPPPTYVQESTPDQNDPMAIDGQRLPDLRFVAKFDPPLVVPIPTAANIINSVNSIQPSMGMYPIYHFELLKVSQQNAENPIQAEQKVVAFHEGEEKDITHCYRLDVSKADYALKIDHLPFSHPRELIELLPTFRQWASTSDLLLGAFGENPSIDPNPAPVTDSNDINPAGDSEVAHDSPMELNGLLDAGDDARLQVDINLSTASNPSLDIAYHDPNRTTVSDVVVQVLPNADIVVADRNAGRIDESGGEKVDDMDAMSEHLKKLSKALEVSGDLGIWVEWMRKLKSGR